MIAHVAGVPFEELLPLVFASGGGAWLLVVRSWTMWLAGRDVERDER